LEILQIKTTNRLLNCIDRRKLAILGYVVRKNRLGKDLITGMVFGKCKRGRTTIKELTNLRMLREHRMVQDRSEWRQLVMDAIPTIYLYNDDYHTGNHKLFC